MSLKPKISRKIKNKEVTVDREAGVATVEVTLMSRRRGELRTKLSTSEVIPIAIEGGAEVLSVISETTITNRDGEKTGKWVFKIPSIDPEHSTNAVLKRREKKKAEAAEKVAEEDGLETPIDAFDG